MTKKNILAAIAALAMSVSAFAGSSFNVNAASCADSDPVYDYQIEEPEYELAPPICILPPEEIPQQAWDDIFDLMDQNDDGEVRVADAIQAKKEGNDKLSDAICDYIINDGYDKYITMSPVPLSYIEETIRKDQFQLVSVWRADSNGNGENDRARFMFINTTTADFFVYETSFVSVEKGFINLWDYDKDGAVTEKDAASVYLNEGDEQKALAISTYAQYGDAGFAAQSYIPVSLSETIERQLADGAILVAADSGDYGITLFDYNGLTQLRWW